ncbi:MAG: N-acetyltransferase [Rhizobiales bacterium]|nr:N-acetyltransferase [Hyphomicrobiales bacterium]
MSNKVRDNAERHRFELDVDGQTAFAVYRREGDTLAIVHTETPPTLRGKGVASALVRGLLDIARAQGLKVAPKCPFVVAYMDKHAEYADLRR